MLRTLVSPWTGCTRAERKNLAWGPFFLTTLVGSGSVCQAVLVVFDAGLSERLLAALEAAFSSPKPSALPCVFRLGAVLMQRLAKPSDYVRQEVLGKSTYVLSWEPRLCPGNPAEDPELGAQLYNDFAQAEANGVEPRSAAEEFSDIIEWAIDMPGEPARCLAADIAAAYQGKYQFRIEDLEHWDVETKAHRAHLIFHNEDIRMLSAKATMALRERAGR
ncbi:hypothetical protein [Pseudomonas sp. TWR2-1-1]|uniref:hypothetical protein n=1 Tax=Pseudomonas sp. TWR2-1-1 TaxID=2804610 RepID=UPI003CF7BE7B